MKKILIMGLPGAGKTTLAKSLAPRLNAVHFNADDIRKHVNRDLGFSLEDRLEHARRLGWLCDQVAQSGGYVIADFVCPTEKTRSAFAEGGEAFTIWVDRIKEGRFQDTNLIFQPPENFHLRVSPEGPPEYWAEQAALAVRPVFDPRKPTALFVGRYQPFHEGHRKLVVEGIKRVGQVCIAVRNTEGTSASNPFGFEYIRSRIEHSLREYDGKYVIVPVPNISDIFHGRDVGYNVERIELDSATEAISATAIRRRIGPPRS